MSIGVSATTLNAYQGLGLMGVFSGLIVITKLLLPKLMHSSMRLASKSAVSLTAPILHVCELLLLLTTEVSAQFPKEVEKLKARLEQWKTDTVYEKPQLNPDFINKK